MWVGILYIIKYQIKNNTSVLETDIQNIISKYSKKNRIQNQKKVFIFSICLFISVFIWLTKKYSKDYIITLPFKVSYDNIPFNKILINNPDSSVHITFKSQGYKLLYYQLINKNKNELKINIAEKLKLKNSNNYLAISSKELINDSWLEKKIGNGLISISPDSIYLNFENAFIKKVPIVPNIKIDFLSQFQLYGNYKVSPDSVLISGTKNDVKRISYIPTEYKYLSNISENSELIAKLLYPKNNFKIRYITDKVKITVPVEKYTETGLEVPLKIKTNNKSFNVKLFPDKVKVSFQVAVKDYKKINSDLFIIQVDIDNGLINEEKKLQTELVKFPDFVRNVKIYPERVEYIIFK